ncbi:MAG: acetyl-CoA carboxylase biotin carboxylase subunit [Acidobacteriota bacterium]|nr:acetyl-CoA carboxylase biotin carboxylase subunit [Acidobacteriota bacterium]
MFKTVLIANRGEIAVRIIAACRELGVRSVVAHSQSDIDALPVRLADRAICIGPAPSRLSYLSVPAVVSAAQVSGADAIHPGYGFLSESAELADTCVQTGLVFIGPPATVLRQLGDKVQARQVMREAGLSIIRGTETVNDIDTAVRVAAEIGYPIMVKATAGGGGRGMRVVENAAALAAALPIARREAETAFGDSRIYLETFIDQARHIEYQVLADSRGRVVHLGERDCSIQRRHQKMVEETPAVDVGGDASRRTGELVTAAVRAVGYVGAGTFEFLRDPQGRQYFMEANARVQVEHGISEMVTGVDVVKEQIRIAAGESLGWQQQDVAPRGHAIECRITAEHPKTLAPSPGAITVLTLPGGPGVRVDTAAEVGGMVSPFYDPLLAKVMAQGRDRHEAIARMRRALSMTSIKGVDTTIPLLQEILSHPNFLDGRVTTTFLDRLIADRA